MLRKLIWPLLVVLLTAFSYTSVRAEPARVKLAEEKRPIIFREGEKGRASYLRTVKVRLSNRTIGELQKGWWCNKVADMVWNKKIHDLIAPEFPGIFLEELQKARYPLPADKIFDTPTDGPKTPATLQIGMLIKEMNANLCAKSDGNLGGVYMKIYWEVYSPEAQRVVLERTTEGTFQPDLIVPIPLERFFFNAFRSAVRNLLAEQGYHYAITGAASIKPLPAGSDKLVLKGGGASAKPLKDIITDLRSAVVTVSSDTGSGSGFFVSRHGDLLTNHHVVGSAKFVKVKLATGRELLAEVIRSDKNADVALIKTEAVAVHPITISAVEPNVGEEVYVLGSPLGDKFSTTLTRGVLSAYRTLGKRRYLQSDVAILPGSSGGPLLDAKGKAIGISLGGLGAKGLAGMNFFIPIKEALGKLNIVFE
jgi:hypothetical protein